MAIEASALRVLQERFGSALEREIDGRLGAVAPEPLFPGMMRYQMGTVDRRLNPTGATGGKRFRPMLCLLVTEACGGSPELALPVAAAIEILHNFSLVHDDIEDGDPERRHHPTVWKVWGEPQAINAGDGMFAVAISTALSLGADPATTLRVTRELNGMALALTRGQFLDMSFEGRADVTVDEYLEMITLKSAAIIAFSMWAGAFIAGAPDAACEAMRTCGERLGRAFQMEDDIQGIWGNPERTGKEPATDIRNRKKTLPVLLALRNERGQDRDVLNRFYGEHAGSVDKVVETLDRLGVREEAGAWVREERTQAIRALGEADLSPTGRSRLLALAHEVTGG